MDWEYLAFAVFEFGLSGSQLGAVGFELLFVLFDPIFKKEMHTQTSTAVSKKSLDT